MFLLASGSTMLDSENREYPGLVLPNAAFLNILLSLYKTRLQDNSISNLILSLSLNKSVPSSLIKGYLYL
jgi:hypothetical protein